MITWKSSTFDMTFELYLDAMELYSSMGFKPKKCRVEKGSIQRLAGQPLDSGRSDAAARSGAKATDGFISGKDVAKQL